MGTGLEKPLYLDPGKEFDHILLCPENCAKKFKNNRLRKFQDSIAFRLLYIYNYCLMCLVGLTMKIQSKT